MSDERPKLYDSKPKKSKLKASSMAPSMSTGATAPPPPPTPPPPPPPPPPVKESFVQRFKFYKTLAVVVSLTVGVYAFARTVLKVGPYKTEKPETESGSSTSTSSATTPASAAAAAAITEQPVTLPTVQRLEPIQRPPVPEDQQREVLKWMLEEKRKMKPRDAEEKKRIDEEKAILKQYIRAKSLPTI